jgi:hypothetical protein
VGAAPEEVGVVRPATRCRIGQTGRCLGIGSEVEKVGSVEISEALDRIAVSVGIGIGRTRPVLFLFLLSQPRPKPRPMSP